MKKITGILLAALAALGLWWLMKKPAATKSLTKETIEIVNDAKQAQQDSNKLTEFKERSAPINDQQELEGSPQGVAVGSNWKSR